MFVPKFLYKSVYFLLVISFLAFNIHVNGQQDNKKVLLLNSYNVGYEWTDSITSGVINVTNNTPKVDLFVEHMDGKRHDDSLYINNLAELYQQKYKMVDFDLVIVSDDLALKFTLTHRNKLFNSAPVVYCGVSNPEKYDLNNLPYFGILETENDGPFLELIQKMLPDLKKIYFIADKTQNGLLDLSRIKSALNILPANIETRIIEEIDVDSLFLEIKTIKKTDAVFLLSLLRDKYGNSLNYGQITSELCSVSKAPVFCNYFSNLGRGVVGGSFVKASDQGKMAAEIGMKILYDKSFKPQKLIVPTSVYSFDYNVLQKFNIPLSILPQGSFILNKPESIFAKYKKTIIVTLCIIVFLLAVILVLTVNIARRKKAERIVIQQFNEIQEQNEHIININQNLSNTIVELETTNEKLNKTNEELIITRDRAEESDRLKSAFLANMSHEIRTPMNGILGFSELLKRPQLSGHEQKMYIDIIEQSGKRMLNIINDLIDIAKIESGQTDVVLKPTNINELIDFIYKFFKPETDKKGLSLRTYKINTDKFSNIYTDSEKLIAILINLIKNAIKYTDSGSIDFGYSGSEIAEEGFIRFFIKDTGIGIEKERHNAIFERFVQADIKDERALQGAGLGLSITKAYVEMLGGRIWLNSEINKGSVFYFTIKIQKPSDQIIKFHDEPAINPDNEIRKIKILIAEDDWPSYLFVSLLVEDFSALTLHAENGIETVEICRNHPDIDLILMDIKMPKMDGYEAARMIRSFNKDVIIIAQTAFALNGDKELAIQAGCNEYITKPIDLSDLRNLIKKYFSK
ncbi:MAG: ATP-binding protein [Bacteroidales bacterium]